MKMATVFVVLGVTVLATVVGGIYQNELGDVATAQTGDCVEMTSTSIKSGYDLEDCASEDANYRVARRLDGKAGNCPPGDYEVYRGKAYGFKQRPRLCLVLNALPGECLSEVKGIPRRVACTERAEHRVTSVVEKYGHRCAAGEKTFTYSSPPSTTCLGKP